MDRRRSHRQPISLSALAHPARGRSWLCGIRDFCQQGMLLTGAGSGRSLAALGAEPQRGDPLALHFSVPAAGGQKHFRVQARIARLLENGQGVGVMFEEGLPAAAFEALLNFAGAGLSDRAQIAREPAPGTQTHPSDAGAAGAPDSAESADSSATAAAEAPAAAASASGETEAATLVSGADWELGIPLALLRDARLSDPTASAVRERLRPIVQAALEQLGAQFVELGSREFLASARDAGSNVVHQRYLDALDLLERHGNTIVQQFVTGAMAQFEAVIPLEEVLERRRRREIGAGRELSVVDSEQFEDWLAVADVIAKSEARFEEVLLVLRARFGLMARPWAHKDALPVGPGIIAWSFADALKHAAMRREVRDDAYRYFEQVLLRQLGDIYERLNAVLDETGAFPPVSRLREALQRRPPPRPVVAPAPGWHGGVEGAVVDGWPAPGALPAGVPGAAVVAHPGYQARGEQPFARPRRGDPYQAARRLSGLVRALPAAVNAVGGAVGTAYASAPAEGVPAGGEAVPVEATSATPQGADLAPGAAVGPLTAADVLEALQALEQQAGVEQPLGARLKPRLLEVLRQRHGGERLLDEPRLGDLELMEALVDALESDRYVTEGVRDWIRRLEITLNKIAARDRSFLEPHNQGNPHSAVTLLNQLARLGSGTDQREGIERDVGRRVDELLDRLVREFDTNPGVVASVVDELYPLVDRQERSYRANLDRTVRASEGRQKLVRARRAVLEALEPRLADREVPELVLQLLNPGWRNLLVHTHLRRGVDSAEWQEQLETLDQLVGQLDGSIAADSPGFVDPDTVLKRVVQGLNGISFDPARRTPLVMALSAALVGDAAGEREPASMQRVAADGVVEALGFEPHEVAPETLAAPEVEEPGEEVHESWAAALARARRIEVGEWLAATDAEGRPQILAVAFLGDDFSAFVLVNRKGVKIRECTLRELTEDLFHGRVTLLDDFHVPLMERASQRMLESLHSRLAFQASHDELTGLRNRREFERLVARAVQAARLRGDWHALVYMDLDQFKLVNSVSGHTAGDELLKRIAGRLASSFANERVHVARLGGDEFGLLAEQCEPAEARELARRVLQSVRDDGFSWESRAYTLSASVGLVMIDAGMESAEAALQLVDQACYAAKEAGRNRIHEYRPADSVIRNRHGIMESVTELDRALAEERLVLNCQPIAPVDPDDPRDPHYEILLTMADETGRALPPSEFILGAETYQRMGAIDRWVIARVFRWMAANRGRLDGLGGFAINVSGQSMNDETFPDFVLQQFELTEAPTSKICFEITETAAIANLENAREFMSRMRIIGCRFALDDFGTGLSSYSYLRNLPVDFVKIDGVFVKALAEDTDDYAVVRSINEIGHYLGKETIAECVESPAVLDRLREMGVDFAQGFYVGRPVPLDELLATALPVGAPSRSMM